MAAGDCSCGEVCCCCTAHSCALLVLLLGGQIEAEVQRKFKYKLQLFCNGGYDTADASSAAATAAAGSGAGGDATPSSPGAPANWRLQRTHRVPALRRVCQKTGIRMLARDYDWTSPTPVTPADIVDIVPVVKHAMPLHALPAATHLHVNARACMNNNDLRTALELASQAHALVYQVCVGGSRGGVCM